MAQLPAQSFIGLAPGLQDTPVSPVTAERIGATWEAFSCPLKTREKFTSTLEAWTGWDGAWPTPAGAAVRPVTGAPGQRGEPDCVPAEIRRTPCPERRQTPPEIRLCPVRVPEQTLLGVCSHARMSESAGLRTGTWTDVREPPDELGCRVGGSTVLLQMCTARQLPSLKTVAEVGQLVNRGG